MNTATQRTEFGSTVHSAQVDWSEVESASSAVVELLSNVEGVHPIDLPPLHGAVDPDALDRLFTPTDTGHTRTEGHIAFVFEDYHVVIRGSGKITAKPMVHGE